MCKTLSQLKEMDRTQIINAEMKAKRRVVIPSMLTALSVFSSQLYSHTLENKQAVDADQAIEKVEVQGREQNLVGKAISASEGVIGEEEIATRPLFRSGELLEFVPGMVVTQHSGSGKANQYFLRGFNLDHGTDFATSIDGMPINMRSHGHGQGYTDLNFIIPETVRSLTYRKGAYYADVGDFSGAGSAAFSTSQKLQALNLTATVGEYGYQRFVATSGIQAGEGILNFALETNFYDGPWTDIQEDVQKTNLFTKYSIDVAGGLLSLSFMGYENSWNSADQIPERAVLNGTIDEFGSLDDTLGGETSRYSVNLQWQNEHLSAAFYAIDYDLNLWSNFTYFLDDPVDGDQFEQVDDRKIYGGHLKYTQHANWNGRNVTNTWGVQARYDDIDEVGLNKSQARQRLGSIRTDAVKEGSIGIFWDNQFDWTNQFRTTIGIRGDYYHFDVESLVDENINGVDLSNNRGTQHDQNISLKASGIYTFSETLEGYISIGQGFHSNDARGTINQVDPNSGETIQAVDPIVDSLGYEVGLRANLFDSLNASIAFWSLNLDSELLFVGDAGNTEPSFRSKRHGLEFTSFYRFAENWTLDFEYAYADASFVDLPSNQDEIPGAIKHVLQMGVALAPANGWFGAARFRYFGERPLVEDGSVNADSSQLVNVNLGYQFTNNLIVKIDVMNAFDSRDHDIDYFYASRLANEPATSETEDLHYHVLEPRSVRFSLTYAF